MTDSGPFIINGAERVVVSQLVRSPGCYYTEEFDTKTGKKITVPKQKVLDIINSGEVKREIKDLSKE